MLIPVFTYVGTVVSYIPACTMLKERLGTSRTAFCAALPCISSIFVHLAKHWMHVMHCNVKTAAIIQKSAAYSRSQIHSAALALDNVDRRY